MRNLSDLVYTPFRVVKDAGKLNLPARTDFKRLLKKVSSEESNNMDEVVSTRPVEYMEAEDTEKVAFSFGGYYVGKAPQVAAKADSMGKVFQRGLVGSLALGLGGALLGGANALISNAIDKRKYENNLKIAVQMTPTLQRYPMQMLLSYLPMIVKASPTVASDPRLLANYMESMLDAEGHLNLATFRELSSLEGNVLQNSALANPIKTELIKGISKGIGQNMGTVVDKGFKAL